MEPVSLNQLALDALDDLKGKDIISLKVAKLTSITDYMIFCTGTSNRHVKSLADNVISKAKEQNLQILGIEGFDVGEWVLVDLGDIVVHVMLDYVRDFY